MRISVEKVRFKTNGRSDGYSSIKSVIVAEVVAKLCRSLIRSACRSLYANFADPVCVSITVREFR